AHRDKDGKGILDVIREVPAPFSPESVVAQFVQVMKCYQIRKVVGDRYAGEWPRERFREYLIDYEVCERYTSDNYLAFLPILNSGRCELLDQQRMISQFLCLERRRGFGGRARLRLRGRRQ